MSRVQVEKMSFVGGCGSRKRLRRHQLKWQSALDSHWFGAASVPQLVNDHLQLPYVFFSLLWGEEARVILICLIACLRPPVILLKEVHLHDVTRDKWRLIRLFAKLGPVYVSKPRVLLHFANRLRPLVWLLDKQSRDEVTQEEPFSFVPGAASDQSQIGLVL